MVKLETADNCRLFVVGTLLLGLALLPFPQNPTYLICGFRWLTGIPCPFCGMTRALSLLLKGQWNLALRFHPLSPIVLAILLNVCLSVVLRWISNGRVPLAISGRVRYAAWSSLVFVFSAFGVVRFLTAL